MACLCIYIYGGVYRGSRQSSGLRKKNPKDLSADRSKNIQEWKEGRESRWSGLEGRALIVDFLPSSAALSC